MNCEWKNVLLLREIKNYIEKCLGVSKHRNTWWISALKRLFMPAHANDTILFGIFPRFLLKFLHIFVPFLIVLRWIKRHSYTIQTQIHVIKSSYILFLHSCWYKSNGWYAPIQKTIRLHIFRYVFMIFVLFENEVGKWTTYNFTITYECRWKCSNVICYAKWFRMWV